MRLKTGTESKFGLCRIPYRLVLHSAGSKHGIAAGIFGVVYLYEFVNLGVGYLLEVFHKLAHGAIVHVIAELHFSSHLVAVGHGHIVHLVAEAKHEHILCISPRGSHTAPHSDAGKSLGVLPVTYHHLAANVEACADMAELTVAVGALVEVHKVHIHGVPRNFGIILGVQVQQRLAELL
ncbi:hypothetical protein IMSAGC008_02402 [Muribaculaceae bacterium]|nr:hypothetical protein IMSAGC008_02402 [Muribaculaceae bacterium]